MFKLVKRLLTLSVLMILISCGKQEMGNGYDEAFTGETYGKAFLLEHSSKNCNRSLSFTNSDRLFFSEYLDGRHHVSSVNYVTSKKNNRKLFHYFYKGAKFSIYKKYNKDGKIISTSGRRDEEGRVFSLCPEYQYANEEGTYESAAASVVGILDNFIQMMDIYGLELPSQKLNLYISPEINVFNKYVNGSSYKETMINNAFYDSKNSMIVFLPQGVKEGQKEIPYGGVALWKLPFVPVHEYAHHIFATNIPEFKKYGDAHQVSSPLCFGKISSKTHFEKELMARNGNVKNFDVYSAFNEGFADLIAFYGNRNKVKTNLKAVTCFEKNREVDSSRFYNGQDKRMDVYQIDSFLSRRGNPFGTCNATVDFSSIHTIGAVFANSFYRVAQDLELGDRGSLAVLLDWTKRLGKKKMSLGEASSRDTFFLILGELKESLLRHTSRIDVCLTMQKHFPFLYANEKFCFN